MANGKARFMGLTSSVPQREPDAIPYNPELLKDPSLLLKLL